MSQVPKSMIFAVSRSFQINTYRSLQTGSRAPTSTLSSPPSGVDDPVPDPKRARTDSVGTDSVGVKKPVAKQAWHALLRWPWRCSDEDKALIQTFKISNLFKLWSCDFAWPDNLFDVTGSLKIHDWYVLCGGLGAYIILQCTGIDASVRDVLVRYLFAVENLQHKVYV